MEILHVLMEKGEIELADPNMRFLALGIALIFLGIFLPSHLFTMITMLTMILPPFIA